MCKTCLVDRFVTGSHVFSLACPLGSLKPEIMITLFQPKPRREEHDAEFQLMSGPPNSSDINQIEYIWDVMGRKLRVQRPPIRNMSDLCDRCLKIWYNLSPAIYQVLVASMPRRVEAVLYTKGELTRY
ncbi:transposase domain containing protein [Trichonephila clavipes]|uniref:Transposase domain containing protein n=1 Tax=Trichonephila clavipes TaxID=2585209 RepID=A0A8X6VII2_TRICX|nr:transposase domain containing protein [Trichonephila clavipes]